MANNQPFLAQLAKQVATSECSSVQVLLSIGMANVGYSGGRRMMQTVHPVANGDMIPRSPRPDSMHMYFPPEVLLIPPNIHMNINRGPCATVAYINSAARR
jgi:hypothetical protein